jgi:hypothetical protein
VQCLALMYIIPNELTAEAYSTNIVASVWLYWARCFECLSLSSEDGKCIIGMQMWMIHKSTRLYISESNFFMSRENIFVHLYNRHICWEVIHCFVTVDWDTSNRLARVFLGKFVVIVTEIQLVLVRGQL